MLFHEPADFLRLSSAEPAASLQPDRVVPQFGRARLTFNMDVRRLIVVTRIEKEPIRTNS